MATYLDTIVTWHRERARADSRPWEARLETTSYDGPSMYEALSPSASQLVKVIAEVKRKSPSKGWIDEGLDPASVATAYERGGAAAISVLTDVDHFAGSVGDLEAVESAVRIPILRKDFTVSENDVLDTAAMGASTVLLIVAALETDELARFLELAARCHLDALVEVHDGAEAKQAVDLGARIIGVNQRDLHSFEVDPERAASVITTLPTGIVSVAESGMRTVEDVERAARAGFDAVLVGETFVRSSDPEATVTSFAAIPRVPRG